MDSCGGANADPALGGVPFTAEIGRFTDPLPQNVLVRQVSVTWRIGSGRQYSYLGIPTVSLSFNGVQLGPSVTLTNVSVCNPSATIPYTFDSGDYANGLPGYVSGGENAVFMSLSGGILISGDWPVVSITYNLPDPIEFNVTDLAPERERRVLISNVRRTEYPDPHFQGLGAQDSAVPMSMRTRNASGYYQAGMPVYLRVVDPPDPSAYMNLPQNPLAYAGDNGGRLAVLDGPGITALGTNFYTATSGTNGLLELTLRLQQPTVAGDNYRVEASYDPGFSSYYGSWKSGALTAWKRVFIEKRRMLRNGLFLAQDAKAGDTFIVTRGNKWGGNQNGTDDLSKNEKIVITHGPQRDRSDLNAGWYHETHTILSVVDLGNEKFRVNLGHKVGNQIIPEPLQHDFKIDTTNRDIGDGISKIDTLTLGPDDYFDALPNLVAGEAFLAAFTENIVLPDTTTPGAMVPVPFVETDEQFLLQDLAEKWSSVVNLTLLPNHQLLVIASANDPEEATGAGVTISHVPGKTSSYVFRRTIEEQMNGNNTVNEGNWAMKTAAHEIAHQWETDGAWNLLDHCPTTTKTYNDPGLYCLLAAHDPNGAGSVAQRTNGIARFHLLPLPGGGWHSEYFGIRRRPDPFVP